MKNINYLKKLLKIISKIIVNFLIKIIIFYQKHISSRKGPSCIYIPTCSHYSKEALQEWGVIKGSILSLYRILRCNPFFKPKYDPVPKRKQILKK